jgi:uncharacterized RDD family membrane protein YckC
MSTDKDTLGDTTILESSAPVAPATFGRRILALLIDMLLLAVPCGVLAAISMLLLVLPKLRHHEGGANGPSAVEHYMFHGYLPTVGIIQLAQATLAVAYFAIAHWLTARTVGKSALRLRVVTARGEKLGFGRSLLRATAFAYPPFLGSLGFISFRFLPVGQAAICCLTLGLTGFAWVLGEVISAATDTRWGRSLHDRVSATRVISATRIAPQAAAAKAGSPPP